jgi:Tfp pilus assembly protein PilN
VLLSDFISWFSGSDSIYGLEIYVSKDLQNEYKLLKITKKKGSLISSDLSIYNSIDELLVDIPKNASIALVYNGKGIIHRPVSGKDESINDTVKQIFPDIKYDDFLYQQTKTTSSQIISLIRKEQIEELIRAFGKNKNHIVSLTIGPFITATFLQVLNKFPFDISYDYYHLKTNTEGDLIHYELLSDKVTEEVSFGDETVKSDFINAYSAACIYLLSTTNEFLYPRVEDIIIDNQVSQFKKSIRTRRGGLVFLGSILLILLVNFSFFSNLRKENNFIKDQLAVSQFKLKRLDSLEAFINQKKNFLGKAGWIEKKILSQKYDVIAQTIPDEIKLTELTIHPIDIVGSRNAKETIFLNNKIIIKGLTKKITSLNDWLKILDQNTSIESIHMEEYHFDTQSQQGEFKLEGLIH